MRGELSVGAIVAFLYYLSALYTPLEAIMYTTSTIQGASGSARRVLEIFQTEADVRDSAAGRVNSSTRVCSAVAAHWSRRCT